MIADQFCLAASLLPHSQARSRSRSPPKEETEKTTPLPPPPPFNAHLFEDDTLGVRRTTGRGRLVNVTESTLLVTLVGPSVFTTRRLERASGLETTRLAGCMRERERAKRVSERAQQAKIDGRIEGRKRFPSEVKMTAESSR